MSLIGANAAALAVALPQPEEKARFIAGRGFVETYDSLLPREVKQPRPAVLADSGSIIRFENVGKYFPPRKNSEAVEALVDIDLAVPTGSIVGVIGRSGAGKSTLIRLVNGLEKPSSGRVIVDGVEVSALEEAGLRKVRRSIGMIFQHFNLLSSRTVYANVALPLEIEGVPAKEIRGRVEPLLELVGLKDKRDRYPVELSGGQKQRVGIARALATKPKVLLSDEATSALDPDTTRSILDLLARINGELGLTILLITHEMSVIRRVAKRVAVLEAGKIVEQGDVFGIFTDPKHETTRSFLGSESGRSLPPFVAARLMSERSASGRRVLRLIFKGEHATAPVLSELSREFNLDINILSGSIDEVAGKPFGNLVIAAVVNDTRLAQIKKYLNDRGLSAEELGYVA